MAASPILAKPPEVLPDVYPFYDDNISGIAIGVCLCHPYGKPYQHCELGTQNLPGVWQAYACGRAQRDPVSLDDLGCNILPDGRHGERHQE
jgi:hypothetical protein